MTVPVPTDSQRWRNQSERRFELDRDTAVQVIALVSQHLPVVTYEGNPPTTLVSTLYFDTPDGYYLRRSLSETESSIKIRAREYLSLSDDEERRVISVATDCFLECKQRQGHRRNKYRVRVDKNRLSGIVNGSELLPGHDADLRAELEGRDLVPTLISMYERRVWGSDELDLRLTFDERIRYYKPPSQPYSGYAAMQPAALGQPHALGPKRILEVKHSAGNKLPTWLDALLSGLQESTDFSKFLNGMSQITRRRRFVPSLTQPVYKLP